MSPLELDPRFTFASFVVGSANRLTVAAARRVAESPGDTYNPLFIYSGSGLGKTHLLTAIGHQVSSLHTGLGVLYDTLEHFMDDVRNAMEAGDRNAFRSRLSDVGVLLVDDVQFLAGHRQTQEELLRAWDALSARGGQVILTSDRPPHEIDGLDERLLSRFSGGLIIDMGAPDYETRIAIVRRKADERDHELAQGVPEALARIAFSNVRELQGALNRVIAVQELEKRQVEASEVAALLGTATLQRGNDEFGEFLSEITGAVSEVVAEAERLAADAILRWEGAGYRTRRLEAVLSGPTAPARVEEVVRKYEADAARLEAIEAEIRGLDPEAPELDSTEVLRDPDRLGEAEALLAAVRERGGPLPAPPAGTFGDLEDHADSLAVRAGRAVAEQPGTKYNPLYIHGADADTKARLAAAIANHLLEQEADARIAFLDAADFSRELIDALEGNRLEAWRGRYRSVQALLLQDVDGLGATERAQQELFGLFEELSRAGVQLVFTASAPPQGLDGLHERLRSRLESGLVVELDVEAGVEEEAAGEEAAAAPATDAAPAESDAAGSAGSAGGERHADAWYVSPEKVPLSWPYAEDWLIDEAD